MERIRIVTQLKGQKQREVFDAVKQQLRDAAKVVVREELLQPPGAVTPDTTSQGRQAAPARPIPPAP